MKPEETLQLMADIYSTIFPTRRLALHHLFLTVGNGADWINGEVVYRDDPKFNRYLFRKTVTKAVFLHEDDYISLSDQVYLKSCERGGEPVNWKQINPYLNIDYDSEYILLNRCPDDITPEWKELVQECKEYIRREGISIN